MSLAFRGRHSMTGTNESLLGSEDHLSSKVKKKDKIP